MARAAHAPDPVSPVVVRLPDEPARGRRFPSAPNPLAAALQGAVAACDAAIAYRVQEGTRPPGNGLLTALVDSIEVGQTVLDLARRESPLLPTGLELCRQAFVRARRLCLERGDPPLASCADALAAALPLLRQPMLSATSV